MSEYRVTFKDKSGVTITEVRVAANQLLVEQRLQNLALTALMQLKKRGWSISRLKGASWSYAQIA
jgi:hypothetical protein